MRLHSLEFAAIGPFRDRGRIDFATLGNGLFLLEGPTGVGKSTIIDAIVFALYGRTASSQPGAEAQLARMHSDYASAGEEPYVELTFETDRGIYRVRRTPKYRRPKRRGSGFTEAHPTVKVWRLSAPDSVVGEPISTRVDEADRELAAAIGLSREQFVQTVILPQGEFARFLGADSATRTELLQKLFGTEIYQRLQAELESRRREASRRIDAADRAVDTAVAGFIGAVDPDSETREQLEQARGDDEALIKLLDTIDAALTVAAQQEATAAQQAREQLAEDRQARDRCAEQLKRETRRREITVALAGMDPAAIVRDEARLEAAERATAVVAIDDSVAPARAELAELDQLLADGPDPAKLADTAKALAAELARLDELVALEEQITEQETELTALEQAADAAQRNLTQLAEQREEGNRQFAALEQELAEMEPVARELGTRTIVADQIGEQLEAARRAQTCAGLVERLGAQHREAATAAKARLETEIELQERRLRGMAAELASELTDGVPCPVCGAREHPAPAHSVEAPVTASAVAKAHRLTEVAADAAEKLREQLHEAEATLARERGAAGDGEVNELRERRLAAIAAVEAATEADKECARIREEFTTVRADLADLSDQIEQATQIQTEAAQTVRERIALLVAERSRLAAASLPTSAAEHKVSLQDDLESVEQQLAWHARRAECARAVKQAATAAETAAVEAGFAAAKQARADALASAEREELARAVKAAREQLGRLHGELDALDALDPPGTEPAQGKSATASAEDLQLLETKLLEAQERARLAGAAETQAAGRAQAARRESTSIGTALRERSQVTREASAVIELANLASGDRASSGRRIPLASYVLSRRFEDVVAAANERLIQMSDGRYQLERVDESDVGGSRKAGGLGLRVVDLVTERPRSPRTLSGGESFYVALSLALGLADVVTAESGGIAMGTLFIDEGFGSLDADALDSVLAVLDRLRAGGRQVGIVSHVAELKTRISDRIEVRRRSDGTSAVRIPGVDPEI